MHAMVSIFMAWIIPGGLGTIRYMQDVRSYVGISSAVICMIIVLNVHLFIYIHLFSRNALD